MDKSLNLYDMISPFRNTPLPLYITVAKINATEGNTEGVVAVFVRDKPSALTIA